MVALLLPLPSTMPLNTEPVAYTNPPSWFSGAPASRVLIALSFLSYLVLHKSTQLWAMDSFAVLSRGEYYRLLTSQVAFSTPGEALMGSGLLIFGMRQFEREMGSRRFVTWLLSVVGLATSLEIAMIQLAGYGWKWEFTGPYPLVGAIWALFHWYAPRMYPNFIGVLGVSLSEKALYYVWFLQVVMVGRWHTMLPVALGWVSAWMYSKPSIQWDFPEVLVNFVSPIGEYLGDGPPRIVLSRNARQPHPVFARPPPRVPPVQAPPPVDEGAVEQLVNMGFARDQVVDALRASQNDVNRAADRLLTS